jgi:hypothetical protein
LSRSSSLMLCRQSKLNWGAQRHSLNSYINKTPSAPIMAPANIKISFMISPPFLPYMINISYRKLPSRGHLTNFLNNPGKVLALRQLCATGVGWECSVECVAPPATLSWASLKERPPSGSARLPDGGYHTCIRYRSRIAPAMGVKARIETRCARLDDLA